MSEQKNATGAAAEQSVLGKDVEKRYQPRSPLIHRPMSMPLDKLLQGQLSLCSPDTEQQEMSTDTGTG